MLALYLNDAANDPSIRVTTLPGSGANLKGRLGIVTPILRNEREEPHQHIAMHQIYIVLHTFF